MGRRVATLVVAIVSLSIAAPQAFAGGSFLTGRRDVSVGAVVTLRGSFGPGQQARVSEGPWYGYLIVKRPGPDRRLLLGPVEIRRSDRFNWLASITFTVPQVASGDYLVHVCDLGCHTGVGDLIGGYVFIAATAEQARFLRKLEHARSLLERARDDRARLKESTIEREARIEALLQEQASREAELRGAADREQELAASLASEQDRAGGYLAVTMAFGVALLLALLVIVWMAARRPIGKARDQAARTLVTGARRSATLNHEAPASPDPKTWPLVAPK
jgi:hypothetical protein